ncbi:MAG: HAD-IC family P-type ATPase, partial [Myxococcales bacterium]|nr:HAD-IC family P-type ATPase [Myxococcales bacterium]
STLRRLLDRAESEKPSITLMADRLARHFVAGVLVASLLGFAFWYWHSPEDAIWILLSMLVVSCPCALSLATPTAVTAATAALANIGFLSTRSHTIESLRAVTDVVFDKTGTLTEGRFSLTRTVPLADLDKNTVESLAASLEQASEHPIARAFHPLTGRNDVTDFSVIPNEGVQGRWQGQHLRIGKPGFAGAGLTNVPPAPESTGQWVLLASEQQALAWFKVE